MKLALLSAMLAFVSSEWLGKREMLSREAERLQLVGDRRLRHAEQLRQIAYAQFAEQQRMQQLRPRPVAAQLEQHGHFDVLLLGRHLGADIVHNLLVDGLVVVFCYCCHRFVRLNG